MADPVEPIVIPQRALFKASEVCELLRIQPYVLRSWENEFKDLGVAKTPGGPRTYRRADVERALRIRQLVFQEGLTLAGARRRMEQENSHTPTPEDESFAAAVAAVAASITPTSIPIAPQPAAASIDSAVRERIDRVRADLRQLLTLLGGAPPHRLDAGTPSAGDTSEFALAAPARKRRAPKTT